MYIETAVYTVLSNDAALIAECPAEKIFPRDPARQNVTLPFIVHFGVATDPTHTHGRLEDLEIYPFYQVSVFAASMLQARTIADLVKRALDGHHVLATSPEDSMTAFYTNERTLPDEFDIRAVQIAIDFRISHYLN